MHEGRLIFAQLLDYLPREVFDDCLKRYDGNYNSRGGTCRDQFFVMAFAQNDATGWTQRHTGRTGVFEAERELIDFYFF